MNQVEFVKALELLRVPKEKTHFLMDKYPYFTYEEYRERMIEAFGYTSYEEDYTYLDTITLTTESKKQVVGFCRCTLTFYDDNRNIIYKTTGTGSKEVVYATATDRLDGLSNLGATLDVSAYKSACKTLGIFGSFSDDDKSVKKAAPSFSAEQTGKYKICSIVSNFRDKKGNKAYKLSAIRVSDNALCEIVFFNGYFAKDEKSENHFLTILEKIKHAAVVSELIVKENQRGNNSHALQLSFVSFA